MLGPVPFQRLRLREQLWHLEGRKCHWCGQETLLCSEPRPNQATVDHVIPRGRGGSSHRSNCVSACYECNGRRNDEDLRQTEASRLPRGEKFWLKSRTELIIEIHRHRHTETELRLKLEEYEHMSLWAFAREKLRTHFAKRARARPSD